MTRVQGQGRRLAGLASNSERAGVVSYWQDARVSVALFATLIIIYLLTFSGEFSSIDELAMYAASESLVQIHRLATPQITFASLHNPVGLIEPGQAFVAAPLYWLAQRSAHINSIHAVLTLNVWVTALTGVVLYLLLRRLQFSVAIACLTALGYGVATTAWPYTRTLFREPLVGLMWALAALCLIAWKQSGRFWQLFICFLSIAFGIIVKVSAVAAVPVFLVAVLSNVFRQPSRRLWMALGGGLLTLTVFAAMFVGRFGNLPPLAAYTIHYPWMDMLWRSYGLLFSPAKGLAFYSPVLLIGALGVVELARRQRVIVWVIAGTMLSTLYVYGNYASWYGGLVWGPRFMVPLLPLLTLPLAGMLSSRRLFARIFLLAGGAVSALLQLAAATADCSDAIGQLDLFNHPEVRWYDLRLWFRSPALFQAAHWQPEWLNVLWWHTMSDEKVARDWRLAIVLIAFLAVALAILVWALRAGSSNRRVNVIVLVAAALLVVVGSSILLWRGYDNTRDYPGMSIAEARDIARRVSSLPAYTLVSVSNEFHIYFWLGLLKGQFTHYWYSPAATGGFEPILESRAPSQFLWFVMDRVHLQPDHSGYDAEFWLNRHAYQVRSAWAGGYKVLQYMQPVSALSTHPVSYSWGEGIALVSFGQQAEQLHVGESLRLDLEFQRIGLITENYQWIVHLVSTDGRVLPGHDGEPQYGGAPTGLWREGERIPDRRAFIIPLDAAPGLYTIQAGFVGPTQGRLPARAPDQTGEADHVVLGKVEILP